MKVNLDFYKNKRIFVTGHTGFKGSWLCKILTMAGADVTGYALEPPTEPNLYTLARIGENINSVIGDIRDFDALFDAFNAASPEIVFHLASQPIVTEGYLNPRYTYETNVMGTVNILECIRRTDSVRSFLNVTTDKVYKDNDGVCREDDALDGADPYSNSKSCSEIITHSYKNSFFTGNAAISTARAGNVIGGGDFARNRIIPDCVRAAVGKTAITVHNPSAKRPFQHVLESLSAYLLIAEKQYEDTRFSDYYNVGPDVDNCVTVGALTQMFCDMWGDILWIADEENKSKEVNSLRLDCSKIKAALGWKPVWSIEEAMKKTIEWTKIYLSGGDVNAVMEKQVKEFLVF